MTRASLKAGREVALEALAIGKKPADVATEAGVDLATVREWMTQDAPFRAELNAKRQDAYSTGADRLRALVPAALDVLESELDGTRRLQAALGILKAAGLARLEAPKGETDPEAIEAADRRAERWALLDRI